MPPRMTNPSLCPPQAWRSPVPRWSCTGHPSWTPCCCWARCRGRCLSASLCLVSNSSAMSRGVTPHTSPLTPHVPLLFMPDSCPHCVLSTAAPSCRVSLCSSVCMCAPRQLQPACMATFPHLSPYMSLHTLCLCALVCVCDPRQLQPACMATFPHLSPYMSLHTLCLCALVCVCDLRQLQPAW